MGSGFRLALWPIKDQTVESIDDPMLRLRAGLWGIGLGAVAFPVGLAQGWLISALLLRAVFGGHAPRELHVPNFVLGVIFFVAAWGGLVFLIGWLRVLQVTFANTGRWLAMVVLPLVATCYLVALLFIASAAGAI